MAQLEILQCSGCGSPLAPSALSCEYCGNRNVVKFRRNPLKITSKVAAEYIAFYSAKKTKDLDSLYAMGLFYLGLKNYELARRSLRDAIDRSPLNSEVYYYHALALLAGENIKAMPTAQIEHMEQYLGTAIGMETRCKSLALLAIVKEEYYVQNHLVVPGETVGELIDEAMNYSPEELDEITEHCVIQSERARYYIDLLTGAATLDETDVCADEIDEHERVRVSDLTAERRRHFYEYCFEPGKPHYGDCVPETARLHAKGSYFALTLQRAGKLAAAALLSIVVFTICLLADWGFATTGHPLNTPSVAGQRDSLMSITHIALLSQTVKNGQQENRLWLRKSADGYFWFTVVMAPLMWWLTITATAALCLHSCRRKDAAHNHWVWERYRQAVELHRNRPTNREMAHFISNFLSRLVEKELARHGKNGNDLKGKTLFLSEFANRREDEPNYRDSVVSYKVVILEADSASVITNCWRVYEDAPDVGTIEAISYSDIKEIKLSPQSLSFGGIAIGIPDVPLFESRSSNCTSDTRQFAVALRRLQTAYKNRLQTN